MKKTGILTYHYSNNYGGVLQSYALYAYLKSVAINAEILDYTPSSYQRGLVIHNILISTGLRKNPLNINLEDLVPRNFVHRVNMKWKYNKKIAGKFDLFRNLYVDLSRHVQESSIHTILADYKTIIVGSDQVWGPVERNRSVYFLDFDEFKGNKVSYAADSTIAEVSEEHLAKLIRELGDFEKISVRNKHSQKFVETVIGEKPPIVADPTLLWDFDELGRGYMSDSEPYILVYVLGKDINGSNRKAVEEIKRVYGNLKVYAIVIPTMKFNICDYADKVFYDLGPEEWLDMIRNATFVYTDSFHGTLFSLKFHKPFLAYYAEEMRATRFIDLAERYQIGRYIVSSVDEIEAKGSLLQAPDFATIDQLIKEHRSFSIRFLEEALGIGS